MPSGEARGRRAGPTKDPNSARSEKLGIKYQHLPAAGHRGRVPKWPFAEQTDREKAVWRETWRTPQAEQWAREKLWRLRTIALYVRWSVRAEDVTCSGSVLTQVNRLADQLGLTPAGLIQNGWKVVDLTTATTTATDAPAEKTRATPAPRRPLTMIDGGA